MAKYVYRVVFLTLIYVFIEGFSFGSLYFLKKVYNLNYEPADVVSDKHKTILKNFIDKKTNYLIHSPPLGWTIKKNGSTHLYRANSAGIRSSKEYTLSPSNAIRISTFGDSFTHCDEVKNDATWQVSLESLDKNLQVLNYGVGGFGVDQAYLRYLETGVRYSPHIVFIGFMPENIFRHLNTYRPFYYPQTGTPLTKPQFVIKDEDISLIPNPMRELNEYNTLLLHPKQTLPKLGANDFYYPLRYKSGLLDFSPTVRVIKMLTEGYKRYFKSKIILKSYYNENSEAFKITSKLFDKFYNSAVKNKSIPVILVFPTLGDVNRYQERKTKQYMPLLSHFDSNGYQYIDLLNAFDNVGEDYAAKELFIGNWHFTPFGNKLVAEYLNAYLNKNGLKEIGRLKERLIQLEERQSGKN